MQTQQRDPGLGWQGSKFQQAALAERDAKILRERRALIEEKIGLSAEGRNSANRHDSRGERYMSAIARWPDPQFADDGERQPEQFKSLGEFVIAIVRRARDGVHDPRLIRAPTGANIGDPSAGGFLVGTDFANQLLTGAYTQARIAPLVTRLPTDVLSDKRISVIDETSRATGSRFGGVSSFWVTEGTTVTESHPRLGTRQLAAKNA